MRGFEGKHFEGKSAERTRKTCPYIFSSSEHGRRRILGVAVAATGDKRKSVVQCLYTKCSLSIFSVQ